MKNKVWILFSFMLIAVMVLAACAPAATPEPTEAPVVEEPVATEAPVVEEPVATEPPATEAPVATEPPPPAAGCR